MPMAPSATQAMSSLNGCLFLNKLTKFIFPFLQLYLTEGAEALHTQGPHQLCLQLHVQIAVCQRTLGEISQSLTPPPSSAP